MEWHTSEGECPCGGSGMPPHGTATQIEPSVEDEMCPCGSLQLPPHRKKQKIGTKIRFVEANPDD